MIVMVMCAYCKEDGVEATLRDDGCDLARCYKCGRDPEPNTYTVSLEEARRVSREMQEAEV